MLNKSHTGEMLSNCLSFSECLTTWDIPASKVLLIVSDNGANAVGLHSEHSAGIVVILLSSLYSVPN